MKKNPVIDVHHHVSPPEFVTALVKHQLGERPMLDWTIEVSPEPWRP